MSGSEPAFLRPRPLVDDVSRPFWYGVARRELAVQRCRACGHYQHPPYPECTKCRTGELGFEVVAGNGVIFQRVIVEAPVVVGFAADVPYACLMVELDEHPGLLVAGNLVDASPYEAWIGRRVELVFRDDPDGFTLPMFSLAEEDPS